MPKRNIFYSDKINKQSDYRYIIEDLSIKKDGEKCDIRINEPQYSLYLKKFDSEYRFDPVMKKMLTDDEIDSNIRKIKQNIEMLKNDDKSLLMANEDERSRSYKCFFNADLVRIVDLFREEILLKLMTVSRFDITFGVRNMEDHLTKECTSYEKLVFGIHKMMKEEKYRDENTSKIPEKFFTDILDRLKKKVSPYTTLTKEELIDKYEKQLKMYANYKTYPKYLIDTLVQSDYSRILHHAVSFKQEKGLFFMYDIMQPCLKRTTLYNKSNNSSKKDLYTVFEKTDGVIFKKI